MKNFSGLTYNHARLVRSHMARLAMILNTIEALIYHEYGILMVIQQNFKIILIFRK